MKRYLAALAILFFPFFALATTSQTIDLTAPYTWTGLQNFSNATSTGITSTYFCFTGDICRTTWPTVAGSASSTLLSDNNTFSGNTLFTASTTFAAQLNLQNASSTGLTTKFICLTSDTCRTTWPTGGGGSSAWPFTPSFYDLPAIATANQSTTTPLWLKNTMIIASSTYFTTASTTNLTVSGSEWHPNLTSKTLLALDQNGMVISSSTIGNSQLQNSAITVTTAGPLGGAGTISLGGTLALTCSTCLTSLAGAASSTLLIDNNTFSGKNMFLASTTIGNGTDGLTIFGAATTTGNAYFAASAGIGTSTPKKLLQIVGNQSGGIMSVTRQTAGVAGSIFGTQDIDFWDTTPGNNLLGPAQTFSYTANGTANLLGDVSAFRNGLDSTGNLQLRANGAGALKQTFVIDGSNGDVAIGTTTPSNSSSQCGNFTFCNVFIDPTTTGNEAQIKNIASSSVGQVRTFFNARDVDGIPSHERGEIGTETNNNFNLFSNNTARMVLTKIGGVNIGPTFWDGSAFPNISGGLLVENNTAIGTSTPNFGELTLGTSTAPQLVLSDNISADNLWTLRNTGNTLYIATSTATATSSKAAIAIDPNGKTTLANELIGVDATTSKTGVISPMRNITFNSGTTTTWTATTSGAYVPKVVVPFSGTIQNARCNTDAGFLNVDFYHTTTHLPLLLGASSTIGVVNFASNNTFSAGEVLYMTAGTTTTSLTTNLSCTVQMTETAY